MQFLLCCQSHQPSLPFTVALWTSCKLIGRERKFLNDWIALGQTENNPHRTQLQTIVSTASAAKSFWPTCSTQFSTNWQALTLIWLQCQTFSSAIAQISDSDGKATFVEPSRPLISLSVLATYCALLENGSRYESTLSKVRGFSGFPQLSWMLLWNSGWTREKSKKAQNERIKTVILRIDETTNWCLSKRTILKNHYTDLSDPLFLFLQTDAAVESGETTHQSLKIWLPSVHNICHLQDN